MFKRLILVAALAVAPLGAAASDDRPIKVVVPYGAGGLIDVMTRIVTSRMTETLGVPIIVENRPGGNANIGAAAVAGAAPDGRTVLASSSYFTTNPLLEPKLRWSPDQLTPVACFALSPSALVVGGGSPYKTLAEMLEAAKTPRAITTAEAGPGASQTMVKDLLGDLAGVEFLTVQYAQGGTSYLADLVGGTISMGVIPMAVALGPIKGGQMRALAITSDTRSPHIPDTPTLAEAGFAEAGVNSWVGFHVPAGTPPEQVRKLADAVAEATANAGVQEKLAAAGAQDAYLDTGAFSEFLRNDLTRGQRFVNLRKKMAANAK